MVHSVSGWMRGVQVKLWDPLRTRAIPERLRGVFTTRRYTNPRLPLPWLLRRYYNETQDDTWRWCVLLSSDARHSTAVQLGDDVRLLGVRQLRRVWRTGQHLLHLLPQDSRGQREGQSWAARTHWLLVVLSVHGWQSDRYQLRRHDLVSHLSTSCHLLSSCLSVCQYLSVSIGTDLWDLGVPTYAVWIMTCLSQWPTSTGSTRSTSVTNRQTDSQTDRQTDKIPCHIPRSWRLSAPYVNVKQSVDESCRNENVSELPAAVAQLQLPHNHNETLITTRHRL